MTKNTNFYNDTSSYTVSTPQDWDEFENSIRSDAPEGWDPEDPDDEESYESEDDEDYSLDGSNEDEIPEEAYTDGEYYPDGFNEDEIPEEDYEDSDPNSEE